MFLCTIKIKQNTDTYGRGPKQVRLRQEHGRRREGEGTKIDRHGRECERESERQAKKEK